MYQKSELLWLSYTFLKSGIIENNTTIRLPQYHYKNHPVKVPFTIGDIIKVLISYIKG